MGKFGIHSGYMKAQNVQSDIFTIDTDGSGDGTLAVTFKRKFKNAPVVVLGSQETAETAELSAYNITNTGFTARVDNFSGTATDITVGYIAMDDPASGFS
jgi:hypothetical protein